MHFNTPIIGRNYILLEPFKFIGHVAVGTSVITLMRNGFPVKPSAIGNELIHAGNMGAWVRSTPQFAYYLGVSSEELTYEDLHAHLVHSEKNNCSLLSHFIEVDINEITFPVGSLINIISVRADKLYYIGGTSAVMQAKVKITTVAPNAKRGGSARLSVTCELTQLNGMCAMLDPADADL